MIQENIDFLPMGQGVSSSQFGCYKIKLTRCQDTLVLADNIAVSIVLHIKGVLEERNLLYYIHSMAYGETDIRLTNGWIFRSISWMKFNP